jgi:hypothetical protein
MQPALFPYEGFLVSEKIFHINEQRFMVGLYNPVTKHRTSTSYARYLMSVHLKRKLDKNEHVDHINNDKLDDRIENLQLLSPGNNTRKANMLRYPNGRALITLTCDLCGKSFTRRKHNTSAFIKGQSHDYCSRACSHKAMRKPKR